MACTKYQSWLTDFALGALAPQRVAELRTHLETCPACCEETWQVRALVAKIDRTLEGSIAEEPSLEFYAHTRALLAEQAAQPWPASGSWALMAAGALAATALVTLLVFWQAVSGRRAQSKIAQRGRETQPNALSLPAEPAVSSTSTAAPPKFHRRVNSRLQANRLPEVLIDPSEGEAFLRLAAALSGPNVDGTELVAAQKMPPAPISIEPLKIEPLEVRALAGDAEPKTDGGAR